MHNVQHAVADAGAQVDDLAARMIGSIGTGLNVSLGKIHHVDIVTDAGTVGGVVIVAVHGQLLQLTGGHLGNVGHQVVGNAVGVFANQAAFVGTDGVEVPQQHHAPAGISGDNAL